MPATLKFCGGVRTVTGSQHLIETSDSRVLIDCGLFQGHREEFYRTNANFLFNPRDLTSAVLSHAHIDHSGNIPTLIKQGFNKKVYMTHATLDLCRWMLPDSGHVQEENIKFLNKLNQRENLPLKSPLYTREDAEDALSYLSGEDYHREFRVAEDIFCTFYDAGHILGSVVALFRIGNEHGDSVRLAYVVDLGRNDLPILKDPEHPPQVDYVVMESTYGNRTHPPIGVAKEKLRQTVLRTFERRGKVIIPSFAMERTQEVLYYLNQLMSAKEIPDLPIFVDSPLAIEISGVFYRHTECFDEQLMRELRKTDDPIGFNRITFVRDVNDSKSLNEDNRPMIIISASGMCEAGRILHHLRNNISDEKNTILIVGYMAQNTLGKKLVDHAETVKIFGREQVRKAEVVVINSFSGHADRNGLISYVEHLAHMPKKIFLVHGDEDQSAALEQALVQQGFPAVRPEPGEKTAID